MKPYAQVCSRTAGSQSLYSSACRKYEVIAWALIIHLYSPGLVLVANLSVILCVLMSANETLETVSLGVGGTRQNRHLSAEQI